METGQVQVNNKMLKYRILDTGYIEVMEEEDLITPVHAQIPLVPCSTTEIRNEVGQTNAPYSCFQLGAPPSPAPTANITGTAGHGPTQYLPVGSANAAADFYRPLPLPNEHEVPSNNDGPLLQDQSPQNSQEENKEDDDDDDITIICDLGINRLFPNEPELSSTFKGYMGSLNNQDAEIKSLAGKPPIALQTRQDWRKSFCYMQKSKNEQRPITAEDQTTKAKTKDASYNFFWQHTYCLKEFVPANINDTIYDTTTTTEIPNGFLSLSNPKRTNSTINTEKKKMRKTMKELVTPPSQPEVIELD